MQLAFLPKGLIAFIMTTLGHPLPTVPKTTAKCLLKTLATRLLPLTFTHPRPKGPGRLDLVCIPFYPAPWVLLPVYLTKLRTLRTQVGTLSTGTLFRRLFSKLLR